MGHISMGPILWLYTFLWNFLTMQFCIFTQILLLQDFLFVLLKKFIV